MMQAWRVNKDQPLDEKMTQQTQSPQTLTLIRPDDWHVHLRDGEVLKDTVRDISRYNGRAVVMPNTVPPITNVKMALDYQARIAENNPNPNFKPLMTLYLTDKTSVQDIRDAHQSGQVVACKLYPAGATTNSDSGVTNIENMYPVFEEMAKLGILLLIHGEVTHHDVDVFDREAEFVESKLAPIVDAMPQLKIVLEHITTKEAAEFVANANDNVGATITPQHLLFNRNHMLVGGIRPHFYCLPILKRNIHQAALIQAATSGNPKFFLGTDSAPHAQDRKENACGCAGCYSAHAALELYATAFEAAGKLENLEAFASINGAKFYGLDVNSDTITLQKTPWQVPETYEFGSNQVVPLGAGEMMDWQVV